VTLRAAFRLGIDVIVKLIGEFDNFVQHSGWLANPGQRQPALASVPPLNATVTFEEPSWSDVNRILAHPRQIILPGSFGSFLSVYFRASSSWSGHGRMTVARTDFEAYLLERVNMIHQQLLFLQRHRMNFGGYLPWQLEQVLQSDTRRYQVES
jgi:hypothetical protein